MLNRLHNEAAPAELLKFVMDAQPDNVMLLLEDMKAEDQENYWKAILKKTAAKESHNGREWNPISPLQYAYWAGDEEMVNMLECYFPAGSEALIKTQKAEVDEKGLPEVIWVSQNKPNSGLFGYSGPTVTGHRYENYVPPKPPLRTIVNQPRLSALKDLIDSIDFIIKNWVENEYVYDWTRNNYIVKNIGAKIRELPVYGLQELSRDIKWEGIVDLTQLESVQRDCMVNFTGEGKQSLLPQESYSKGKYYSGLGYKYGLFPALFSTGMDAVEAGGLSVWKSTVIEQGLIDMRNSLNTLYCQRMGLEMGRPLDSLIRWGDQADEMREKCNIQ